MPLPRILDFCTGAYSEIKRRVRRSIGMTTPRDIIVIGASLGGLEGLCKLTSGLPANLSAALLVVLHTGPSSPRLLAEIVGRFSPLPVSYARQGEAVIPGHVYFAPPDLHLTVVAPGFLVLREGEKVHFCSSCRRRPIPLSSLRFSGRA